MVVASYRKYSSKPPEDLFTSLRSADDTDQKRSSIQKILAPSSMAHQSLWLTACGIVLLCVAVPHATCHPRPDDVQHEIMPYYQQAGEPEYYYPSFDEEGEKHAKERTNLQDSEPSLEESTDAPRTEVLEGPRQMRQLTSFNGRGMNTYILLFELVGAFYFAWVLIFPVLRDTNAFGISDLLGINQSTSESLPEMSDVLDRNSTLQTSEEFVLNGMKKKKNKKEDGVVKPIRLFDTISNHKNDKKTKKTNSKDEYIDLYEGLTFISESMKNFTSSWTRTKRDSNYDLLSRLFRLDPVDIALNLLRIEDQPNSKCRERLVCDARYMASTIPYVDDYLPPATSREDFNPVYKYAEAAFIGSQKKDCSIFSCPKTSIQLLTGGL